jgi:arylsulfatase A-like enzyme
MNRPNVLLLTLDTLRADRLGCYGYDAPVTPNIDRLAASGVRFEQAITGGSWTQAAFPVILTSTYASMYGGCLGPLSPQRPSPVEVLAEHGYLTAGFSTSPLLSHTYGYHRGFRTFVDLIPEESDPLLRQIKGGQRLLRSPLTHSLAGLLGIRTRPARLYVPASELTDRVCQWLDQAQSPFFIWGHYMDIHWPYHREETLTHPDEIAQAWQHLGHMHRANWNGQRLTPDQQAYYQHLYDQAVHYTDAQVGRLLAHLERSGRLANTIIILVSDHGEEFLERRRWGHFESNLYDEILKVPFLIRLPDLPTGQIIRRQVRTLDIMPTVLDLCGCSLPPGLEGASLAPLWISGDTEYESEASISEMWRNERHIIAVRTELFKYIWDSRHSHKPELYDLQADPGERHNVHQQYPEQARHFQDYVDAHLERVAAQETAKALAEPELDADLVRRLRDLGYVE